ncbi:MAG TPA: phosphatidylserine/phosphatidylglycerophosphate/cardiolipin synthase family protein [Gemmatimonadaceae bacterium]|nr:phosphatidylserine/phosphatidylglycerophosphate/cardiolipin synthase family protein [Gemmatimonadaceae bacterium]
MTTGIPFVRTGSYPVREGNSVRLLVDGIPAFRRICDAIDAAEQSVCATVTFMWPSFEMPDGRGATLDVLDRAAARGVDVRVIFWRPGDDMVALRRNAFWGSPEHVAQLEARRSGINVRWDRAARGFCQHQKSWLIDAGTDSETAFVGGINLNPHSLAVPGHAGDGQNHDVFLELRGPSVVDVHHNFVERWNEASERGAAGGMWGAASESDLPHPTRVPPPRGGTIAQVQRDRTNFDQYCAAIDAARRSIYIENQYIDVAAIIDRLGVALERGVEVVAVVPAEPDGGSTLAMCAPLFNHENFTLAGIAGLGATGERSPVYVHDKLMLVDDEWATVGSCNLHRHSLFGNSEMNVAFRDPDAVRAMRVELFAEHLSRDTSTMDDRSALRLFGTIARENEKRRDFRDHAWQGLAFSLAGTSPPLLDG